MSSKTSVYWNHGMLLANGNMFNHQGSLEGCVSEHGVYDQLGNAWEWADLGRTATRDEWVEYLRSHGVEVEVNQSWIEISERDSNKLQSSRHFV